jgi:hypothetical protein
VAQRPVQRASRLRASPGARQPEVIRTVGIPFVLMPPQKRSVGWRSN